MKQNRSRALICGTKENSIGRRLAEHLAEHGWEVWLYSRNADRRDTPGLHERSADISRASDVEALFNESGGFKLVVFSADTGTGFGRVENLSDQEVGSFLDAKIRGSIFLVRELMRRGMDASLVWLCGRPGPKPSEFLLYGPVNGFVASLVESVNRSSRLLRGFYLETPAVDSPILSAYVKRVGPIPSEWKVHGFQDVVRRLDDILDGSTPPGFVAFGSETQ